MPRGQSQTILDSLAAPSTDEAFLVLLRVKASDGTVLARFTSDAVSTFIGPDEYLPYPFDIVLPDSQEGQETRARLVMTNVDRQLVDEIRTYVEHLRIDIEVVLGSDTAEQLALYPDMELRNVTYDTATISGELSYESFLREPYPKDLMTGRDFPGLFIQ